MTLAELRQLLADHAQQGADATSNRRYDRAIRQALRSLQRGAPWAHLRRQQQIVVLPTESGSGVTATLDSTTYSLGAGSWPSKYANGQWELFISADPERPLVPTSVASADLTAEAWHLTTGTYDFEAIRLVYTITNAARVLAVRRLGSDAFPLRSATRAEFDDYRGNDFSDRREPRLYTFDDVQSELRVWPPSDQRYALQVDFERPIVLPDVGAAGSTVLDWPDDKHVILEKAAIRELAILLGDKARFDVGSAIQDAQLSLEAAAQETQSRMGSVYTPNYGRGEHPLDVLKRRVRERGWTWEGS